jgi:ABC-type amino acid transport substrate-binding protein
VGQLTKAALMSVKAKAILLGKQLLTTVRQISQAVLIAFKQKKDKLVEKIKLALLRLKENKTVQTLMARLLTQAGSKLVGLAKQLPQRAIQAFKKGQ